MSAIPSAMTPTTVAEYQGARRSERSVWRRSAGTIVLSIIHRLARPLALVWRQKPA